MALLCLLSLAFASEEVHDPDVVVLTDSNFDSQVKSWPLALVEFYAPWCGHCKHLAPEFAKAATELKKLDNPIVLAKLDATVHQGKSGEYGVKGYPTLKVFRNGKASDYDGPREAKGIINFMKKQSLPSSSLLDSAAALKKATAPLAEGPESDKVLFVFYSSDSKGKQFDTWQSVADNLRMKFDFAHVTDPSLSEFRNLVVAYRAFDERVLKHPGPLTKEAIEDFVYKAALPLVGDFNGDTAELYQRSGRPVIKVFAPHVDPHKASKQRQYFLTRVRKAAKQVPEAAFALIEKTTPQSRSEMERLGITGKALDSKDHAAFAAEKLAGSIKYPSKPDATFSTDTLVAFAKDVVAGKVEPFLKSEPVPEHVPGGPRVVVGKNFNEVVLDESKDVLIEFYAPWCGHCKKLEPDYNKLAKSYADQPDVVIAKMDATANDSPDERYSAKGYPTIMFKPAGTTTPEVYNGGRTVKEFRKFIAAHGKTAGAKAPKKKKDKAAKADNTGDEL